MKILMIEDDNNKAEHLIHELNTIGYQDITRAKSCNGGLRTLVNGMNSETPFEFVICDNYMPLYEDTYDCNPYAIHIVREIRRRGYENLPICICSSGPVEKCDANYYLNYGGTLDIAEAFAFMITDAKAYKMICNS